MEPASRSEVVEEPDDVGEVDQAVAVEVERRYRLVRGKARDNVYMMIT